MAVRNKTSDLITQPRLGQLPPDPCRARGRTVVCTGTVANAADDDNLSTFVLASIPADAILDSKTTFVVTNWGYAQVRIGIRSNLTALVNQTKATGNVVTPIVIGDAKHGLPAWQALGLAAAPADNLIDIIASCSANAVAAGTLLFEIAYRAH